MLQAPRQARPPGTPTASDSWLGNGLQHRALLPWLVIATSAPRRIALVGAQANGRDETPETTRTLTRDHRFGCQGSRSGRTWFRTAPRNNISKLGQNPVPARLKVHQPTLVNILVDAPLGSRGNPRPLVWRIKGPTRSRQQESMKLSGNSWPVYPRLNTNTRSFTLMGPILRRHFNHFLRARRLPNRALILPCHHGADRSPKLK